VAQKEISIEPYEVVSDNRNTPIQHAASYSIDRAKSASSMHIIAMAYCGVKHLSLAGCGDKMSSITGAEYMSMGGFGR
jgi:hypothetical protein